jgi:hypothetical protein
MNLKKKNFIRLNNFSETEVEANIARKTSQAL